MRPMTRTQVMHDRQSWMPGRVHAARARARAPRRPPVALRDLRPLPREAVSKPPTLVASPRMVMRAATASLASKPVAATVTCWPLVAPRPITPRTLLASAVLPPAVTETAEANRPAATASAPAGRACRSPARVMPCSQLADMTRLLCRGGDRLDVPSGRGRDRRGHGALDERRVREQHALGVAVILEHRPHREHRAAQV